MKRERERERERAPLGWSLLDEDWYLPSRPESDFQGVTSFFFYEWTFGKRQGNVLVLQRRWGNVGAMGK